MATANILPIVGVYPAIAPPKHVIASRPTT
jgi:hypothetical protein